MNQAEQQAPTVVLTGIASEELKKKVVSKLQEIARVAKDDEPTNVSNKALLAGYYGYNVGIFVVDGNFGREHYKQAIAEATEAGLNTYSIHVFADTCTYSGRTISFMKLYDLGLRGALMDVKPAPQPEPMSIDLTPTWGEVGNIFYRLAATGEIKAVEKMKTEFARAFAGCEAYKQLVATLTPEQKALAQRVYIEEMHKQGVK